MGPPSQIQFSGEIRLVPGEVPRVTLNSSLRLHSLPVTDVSRLHAAQAGCQPCCFIWRDYCKVHAFTHPQNLLRLFHHAVLKAHHCCELQDT
ncbi:MAG: hypothetical protein A2Z04_09675 [Chloroflexi bacterium RBG_16_57_9]|nr:MAG: hypothetical protein A2Z04_09675 [Chloroflexi bacterium RBG_16_57_9]